MSKEADKIAEYQKKLGCSYEDAKALVDYDKAVDHSSGGLEHDLPPDKAKIAQEYTRTGTRKTPTVYNLTKRERKPNETKAGIISEIFTFLEKNAGFAAENVAILNKERQISFELGGEKFELTLVQKRKPKN